MDNLTNVLEPTAGAANPDAAFLSRQPIYTRSTGLFAYELLYRDVFDEPAVLLQDNGKAAAEALLNTFLNVGLDPLVGDTVAFINVPRPLLLHDYCTALPKDRVVLEVSGDLALDQDVTDYLSGLRKLGYKLALHDFEYTEDIRPTLDLVDYASLDLTRLRQSDILKQLLTLKQSKAKVIASKIESHQTFESAKSMGFEYFRGKCFTRPKLVGPTRIPINRLSTLQLVLKLQEPELKIADLEKIVGCDLVISYKLLQYVNSAAISLPRNIESIGHAIRMVGTERIRAWASLLLLSKLDDKPSELILTAFVRARMAELLALAGGEKNPASHYMVGLFSLVDALLNIPMPEAIQLLPFSRPIREALLNHDGPMGTVLSCVLAYESGNWKDVRCGSLDAPTIRQAYLDAISAARKLAKILKKR